MKNNCSKKISLYSKWEDNTSELCEIGKKANNFIEEQYFSNQYTDFFSEQSDIVLIFKNMISYRHQYWLKHPSRFKRLKQWRAELDFFIHTSFQANNKLALLKEWVWAKYSTLPLLNEIETELDKEFSEKILKLMHDIEIFLKNNKAAPCDVLLIERSRLSLDIVKKMNKQRFLNVYQINRPNTQESMFCEVIETWNFEHEKNIDLCLPLSIGCVANCKMCEFSIFKAINIPPATLIQIIASQARNNYDIPLLAKPKYSFYFLGGGDALQYKELPSLLKNLAQSFLHPNQIISTIAFGRAESFKTFLNNICLIPNVYLQWSLMSFSETNRKYITGCHSLIPIQTCINLLQEYSRQSQRKVTVSIMLFKEPSEDILQIKKDILHHLDPSVFRLNFANIQPNHLAFSEDNSQHLKIIELYDWALENHYEATLDSPPENDNPLELCGRITSTVFNGNQPFLKKNCHEK